VTPKEGRRGWTVVETTVNGRFARKGGGAPEMAQKKNINQQKKKKKTDEKERGISYVPRATGGPQGTRERKQKKM